MSTVTQAAVDAINKQNLESAQNRAIVIIRNITNMQDSVKSEQLGIESLQSELAKLKESEITVESVTGQAVSTPATLTQKTVAKAIETLVTAKQGCVNNRATQIGEYIVSKQLSIEQLNKRIAEQQAELNKLEVAVVTADSILA